jgi:hypothetical protein
MQTNRRWIRRVIETARAEAGPLPLRRAKIARRRDAATSGVIRATVAPKRR